jgi:hypothetical protein
MSLTQYGNQQHPAPIATEKHLPKHVAPSSSRPHVTSLALSEVMAAPSSTSKLPIASSPSGQRLQASNGAEINEVCSLLRSVNDSTHSLLNLEREYDINRSFLQETISWTYFTRPQSKGGLPSARRHYLPEQSHFKHTWDAKDTRPHSHIAICFVSIHALPYSSNSATFFSIFRLDPGPSAFGTYSQDLQVHTHCRECLKRLPFLGFSQCELEVSLCSEQKIGLPPEDSIRCEGGELDPLQTSINTAQRGPRQYQQ